MAVKPSIPVIPKAPPKKGGPRKRMVPVRGAVRGVPKAPRPPRYKKPS